MAPFSDHVLPASPGTGRWQGHATGHLAQRVKNRFNEETLYRKLLEFDIERCSKELRLTVKFEDVHDYSNLNRPWCTSTIFPAGTVDDDNFKSNGDSDADQEDIVLELANRVNSLLKRIIDVAERVARN
ncbi:hypothetical protein HDE_01296 [Halotydeus destructor]|nr:hypothetical protein HDE_01296 [Halotydeus destructor]